MPVDGQKRVTEHKGFKVTLQYFKQDPYREDPEDKKQQKKKRGKETVGWSFGIYGVIGRTIHYYTAWSHSLFYGENDDKAAFFAIEMVDTIKAGKKIPEVSTLQLPEIKEA